VLRKTFPSGCAKRKGHPSYCGVTTYPFDRWGLSPKPYNLGKLNISQRSIKTLYRRYKKRQFSYRWTPIHPAGIGARTSIGQSNINRSVEGGMPENNDSSLAA